MQKKITNFVLIFITFIIVINITTINITVPATAKIGYNISVTVDNNTWEIERNTLNFTFKMSGKLNGNGKSIRQHEIGNFAGMEIKECSHSLNGKLSIVEDELVIAREGAYEVTKDVKNNSVNVTINENWPTFIKVNKLFSHLGNGISVKERYENNKEVIQTNFYAKKLVKLTIYGTNLVSMNLKAKITPKKTIEGVKFNRSTYYKLKTGFSDGMANVCYNIGYAQGDERYFGKYTIDKTIQTKECYKINVSKPTDWLNCSVIK